MDIEGNCLIAKFSLYLQVWFKNRRAKVRQQGAASNISNQKSSNRSSNSSTSRHNNNAAASSSANIIAGHNSGKSSTSGMSSSTKTTASMKQNIGSSSNNHHHSNTSNNNGVSTIGHNSSPNLPMTPNSSVSPPVNVICKKEVNNYHNSVPAIADIMKATSIHDNIKDDINMVPSVYSNINGRLGQGGNLTPLGSNSSIITTPSPPITPSQNGVAYVPNHESYFWHPQYNQYPNNYNSSASYYPQMEYQSQANYSMGHAGYSGSNFGLPTSSTLNNSMSAQTFTSNGIDYMNPQDKYANMV